MSAKTLGFGIWGTGMIAEFHAKALAEIPGVKVVAAYNRTAAKAEEFCRKHGATACATPEALLAHPEVDVVCLCTPSGDHLAPALACAKAGKHVVVEKPLEVTLARCDELTAACAKAGVTVAGILPRRFGAGAVALVFAERLHQEVLPDAALQVADERGVTLRRAAVAGVPRPRGATGDLPAARRAVLDQLPARLVGGGVLVDRRSGEGGGGQGGEKHQHGSSDPLQARWDAQDAAEE